MPDQSLISLQEMGGIPVVHTELDKHQIRTGIEQILIRPGHPELRSGGPDTRVIILHFCLGKALPPPLAAQRGIALLRRSGITAHGDGAPQIANGHTFPRPGPEHQIFQPLLVAPVYYDCVQIFVPHTSLFPKTHVRLSADTGLSHNFPHSQNPKLSFSRSIYALNSSAIRSASGLRTWPLVPAALLL